MTRDKEQAALEWAQLGRAIAGARGRRDLTQEELAKLIGVSVKTINTLENGRASGMRANTRAKLEEALGWGEGHVHRILSGETPPLPPASPAQDPVAVDSTDTGRDVRGADQGGDQGRPLTIVREPTPEIEEENEVLAAIRRDSDLDDAARAHFLNQYQLLRELSLRKKAAIEAGEPELLPYAAHGQRQEPVDLEEERRIEREGREAVRRNPDSPARDR